MSRKIPVPVTPDYTAKLARLKCGANMLFPDAKRSSIQSICSRLKRDRGLEFITKSDLANGGIRVWRIA